MEYIIAAYTDIGISKNINQDAYLVKVVEHKKEKMFFAIICDGMGGLSEGEIASATVINAFNVWCNEKFHALCEAGLTEENIREEWTDIVNICNEKIKAYGRIASISLGTTITAILVTKEKYFILNVGDTRAYEITDEVRQLTADHSLVAREIALGHITEEEAKKDPRRSTLLQCVGASETVNPDIYSGQTVDKAVYMLCSDGFRHEISNNEIYKYLNAEIIKNDSILKMNMMKLVETDKKRKEKDNITVVAARTC